MFLFSYPSNRVSRDRKYCIDHYYDTPELPENMAFQPTRRLCRDPPLYPFIVYKDTGAIVTRDEYIDKISLEVKEYLDKIDSIKGVKLTEDMIHLAEKTSLLNTGIGQKLMEDNCKLYSHNKYVHSEPVDVYCDSLLDNIPKIEK